MRGCIRGNVVDRCDGKRTVEIDQDKEPFGGVGEWESLDYQRHVRGNRN